MRLLGFDVETWGDQPTFGLQPFRAATGEARVTSYALASYKAGEVITGGKVLPTVDDLARFLEKAHKAGVYITGWNTAFDAAWLIALGLRDLVYANKWIDGILLRKHLTAIPTVLGRKGYGLKEAVAERWPERRGYDRGIDFSDMTPEGIARRLVYNQLDSRYTIELPRSVRLAAKRLNPMPMTPKLYAQIGEALYNRDWVYRMRELLDIRKDEAERIAYAAAHDLAYDMPEGIERKLRDALDAKARQVAAALVALKEAL